MSWIILRPGASASIRLDKAPVTYSGGLRDDATGHHSFTMMARKGGRYGKKTKLVHMQCRQSISKV